VSKLHCSQTLGELRKDAALHHTQFSHRNSEREFIMFSSVSRHAHVKGLRKQDIGNRAKERKGKVRLGVLSKLRYKGLGILVRKG
jgi:hypothetical protein